MSAALAVVLAVVMLIGLAPAAAAHPRLGTAAGRINSDLWREILAAPLDDQSPFNPGGSRCFEVDGVVAPFTGSADTTRFSCDVRSGQAVFVAGYTVEQSVYEELSTNLTPPLDPSPAGLLRRALGNLPARPTVTFDRKPLHLVKVTAPLADVSLPQPNILGSRGASTSYVAVGWVTAVLPARGTHRIRITPAPTAALPHSTSVITVLHVHKRGHRA